MKYLREGVERGLMYKMMNLIKWVVMKNNFFLLWFYIIVKSVGVSEFVIEREYRKWLLIWN